MDQFKKALASGAEVSEVDVFGESALHKASKAGKLAIVKEFIAQKGPLDLVTSDYGYTALHVWLLFVSIGDPFVCVVIITTNKKKWMNQIVRISRGSPIDHKKTTGSRRQRNNQIRKR